MAVLQVPRHIDVTRPAVADCVDGRLTDDFMKSCKREAALDLKGIRHCTGPLYENGRKIGWFAQWLLPGISLYGNDFSAGQILRAQFCRYDYGTDPNNPEQIFSYWSSQVLNGCPHSMPRHKGFLILQKNFMPGMFAW